MQIAVIYPMIELKTELKKHRGRRPVETYLGDTSGSISDHHNYETISIKGVTHFFVQVMFTLRDVCNIMP